LSSDYSKKEEFRRYLEKTGVLDALTKVLVGLYEEPERPLHAIDYIKRYIGAPPNVDVEGLKRENEQLKAELVQLRKQSSLSSNLNNNNINNSTATTPLTPKDHNNSSNKKGGGTPNNNNAAGTNNTPSSLSS
jgi:hypothetical protein